MEAVDELEAEGDQQSDTQQNEYADRERRRSRAADVVDQAIEREQDAGGRQGHEHRDAGEGRLRIESAGVVVMVAMMAGRDVRAGVVRSAG